MPYPRPALPRPPAVPRALLLALAAGAGCAPLAGSPAPQPPAGHTSPTAAAGAQSLRDGLALLDEAFAMRRQQEQWEEVRPTAEDAAALLEQARAAGGDLETPAGAGLAAAEALVVWQSLLETGVWAEPRESEPVVRARAAAASALLRLLEPAATRVPQARAVRLILLEGSGQLEAAAADLRRGLSEAPEYHEFHEFVRYQGDSLGDPEALAAFIEQAGAGSPRGRAQATASTAYLLLNGAESAEWQGRAADAVRLHERGAEAFARALAADDAPVSRLDLAGNRAYCLGNAGRLRLQRALDQLPQSGLDAVRADLEAAERLYGDALEQRPDDPDAHASLARTADAWYQAGDLPGVRDAFGRLARRFDDADWWNNHAFFCRETGQYEQSFAAYERCIALAPDNARYVNDTALILLYHLDRDLDRAEQLFRRAIALARHALDNPFLDDAARDGHLLACTDAMLNLSLLLARSGRLDQAATQLDELLALSPERTDALELRAQVDETRRASGTPAGADAALRSP